MQNDLISRSDAIKTLREWAHRSLTEEDGARLTTVVGMLENAPAVDAVPAVHGRWDFSGVFGGNLIYQCNLCGRIIVLHEHGDLKKEFPCCHCGARMDGKEPTHE